ncbi:MAG: hypothetical protein JJT81_08560 [Rubellimicrobium sp.]|nr:hypothetical protein [Rubellimicrobium sp.]
MNPVRRRRVFYIPGYDPFHPRRYRELYRKEAAAQSAVSGYEIALSPRSGEGTYGWHVSARIEDHAVEADVEVLVWSDLVRESMAVPIAQTYWMMLRTAWIYITSGTLRRLMWLRKGPVIAALYPVAILIGQLLLAIGLGALGGRIAVMGLGRGADLVGLSPGPLAPILYWAVLIPVAFVLLRWFKAKDNWFYAYYLMHDYAWTAEARGAYPQPLEERLAAFADRVAASLTEDYDEVLLVGHSAGAHLGVTVLADLLRQGRVPEGAVLSLLSVGQVVPMMSFLPKADRLRADLALVSASDRITWVDVTAPGDGCCFWLCDPVAVTGVAPPDKRWPLVFSAAFSQTVAPERWKTMRWRFFRLHFQYLCAFDAPRDYDYFRVTAGPRTLADRYGKRAPSKQRIDVPASKYTSMAA